VLIRRTAALALAALALGACGRDRDDGPDIARPDQLSIQIVSGDRQRAPVAPAPAPSASAGTLAPAATVPTNVLPQPLVARITINGQAPGAYAARSSDPLAPSFTVLPSNTAVTFRVVQPDDPIGRHCGASFLDSGIPDDSGYVTTFWERGTYAGECRMEVRLVVDGQPRVDTVFTATFEPGPAVRFSTPNGVPTVIAGDTIWAPDYLRAGYDAYENEIAPADLAASTSVSWAWKRAGDPTPSTPTGTGWRVAVPAEAASWPGGYCTPGLGCTGPNAVLTMWLNGNDHPDGIVFYVQ